MAQLSKVSKTTQYAEQIEDWVGTCTPALSTIPCTLARTLLFSRLRLHEKHSSAVCVCMPPHLHRDCARRCHICTRDWAHPAYICTGTGLTPATSAPGLGAPLRVRAELLALGAHATPLTPVRDRAITRGRSGHARLFQFGACHMTCNPHTHPLRPAACHTQSHLLLH